MDWHRYGQAEEMQASSEGEMRGVERTRPAGKAKERVTEEKASMEAKAKDLAAKANSRRRGKEVENVRRKTSNSAMRKRKRF